MAQTLLTHEQMIENLIGEFTPSEHPELYRAGFHFVADLIPVDNELWSSGNLKGKTIHNSGSQVRGGDDSHLHLKIISVWRYQGGDVSFVKCKEIPWDEFRRNKDSASLYYGGGSSKNPAYSISDDGRLFISPSYSGTAADFYGEVPDGVRAYYRYWSYEPNDFFTSDSYNTVEDLYGFPRDAQLAAIIKSAMNILQVKMGESVHDDEDSELLQLQQAQMQQLQQWFESEMSRLNVKYKTIGLEQG